MLKLLLSLLFLLNGFPSGTRNIILIITLRGIKLYVYTARYNLCHYPKELVSQVEEGNIIIIAHIKNKGIQRLDLVNIAMESRRQAGT